MVNSMVIGKRMKGNTLAFKLVMEIWQRSNNKDLVENNNNIVRCQNLQLGIRIYQLSLVRIRYLGWDSKAWDHKQGNQCRQINVGEALSRISLHLDKIRCLSRIMVTWGNSKRSTSQMERSEEHTSELQSPCNIVCRLLLVKK